MKSIERNVHTKYPLNIDIGVIQARKGSTKNNNTRTNIKTVKNSKWYDQEMPQSQTADNPVALRGKATQQLRDTSKTTSSLFPIKMITKLERAQSSTQQNIEELRNPTMEATLNKNKTKKKNIWGCYKTTSTLTFANHDTSTLNVSNQSVWNIRRVAHTRHLLTKGRSPQHVKLNAMSLAFLWKGGEPYYAQIKRSCLVYYWRTHIRP